MAIQLFIHYKGAAIQASDLEEKDLRNEYNAIVNHLTKKSKGIFCEHHDFDSNLIIKTDDFDHYEIDFQACCTSFLIEMEKIADALFQPEHRKNLIK